MVDAEVMKINSPWNRVSPCQASSSHTGFTDIRRRYFADANETAAKELATSVERTRRGAHLGSHDAAPLGGLAA